MQIAGGNTNPHVSSKQRDDPICMLLKVNFINFKRLYHTAVFYSFLHEF